MYAGAEGLSRMSAGGHLLASKSKSFTELCGFQRYANAVYLLVEKLTALLKNFLRKMLQLKIKNHSDDIPQPSLKVVSAVGISYYLSSI